MSHFNANPPAYNSPSASDDITKILERALDVQKAFTDARVNVQQIDKTFSTTFEKELMVVDDIYYKVFNDSRTAANTLYSALDQFQSTIVPLSQNADYPVDRRAKSVKTSADKIAAAAKANAAPLDSGVAGVINGLTTLYEHVDAAKDQIKQDNKEALDELSEEISKLAKQISEDGKLFERLSFKSKNIISTFKSSKNTPPAPEANHDKRESHTTESDKKLSDKKSPDSTEGSKEEKKKSSSSPDRFNFIVEGIQEIGKFFASEAKHKADKAELDVAVGKLAQLNAEIESQLALLDRSGEDIKGLTEKCKALVSKLGKFSAVWKKLESDAALLSEYLTENGLDETTIVSRVVAESQVYDKIKHALDEYVLRAQ